MASPGALPADNTSTDDKSQQDDDQNNDPAHGDGCGPNSMAASSDNRPHDPAQSVSPSSNLRGKQDWPSGREIARDGPGSRVSTSIPAAQTSRSPKSEGFVSQMLSAAEKAPSAEMTGQPSPSREPLQQPGGLDSEQHEETSDESSALQPAEDTRHPDRSAGDSADQEAPEVSTFSCVSF